MSTPSVAAEPSSEIEAANRRFMEAFGRGDASGVAQMYTSGAQLLPAYSDFVAGASAIQSFWQRVMDMGIQEVILETLELEPHGETANEMGRYTLKVAGGQLADTGKYLVIWMRDGESWKVHRDIWTTSQPAA
jgi:ketosteroid isomerase-like protein